MSTAFVLFKCQPQRELEVYLALLEIDSVSETHVAYGEYDLVARIDFEDDRTNEKKKYVIIYCKTLCRLTSVVDI